MAFKRTPSHRTLVRDECRTNPSRLPLRRRFLRRSVPHLRIPVVPFFSISSACFIVRSITGFGVMPDSPAPFHMSGQPQLEPGLVGRLSVIAEFLRRSSAFRIRRRFLYFPV